MRGQIKLFIAVGEPMTYLVVLVVPSGHSEKKDSFLSGNSNLISSNH